jgi:hypothetical protein
LHSTASRSICAGEHDIELRPKTFEVLRYLAENAGRLVSKQDLYQTVWPDVTVSDDSIAQCIGSCVTSSATMSTAYQDGISPWLSARRCSHGGSAAMPLGRIGGEATRSTAGTDWRVATCEIDRRP